MSPQKKKAGTSAARKASSANSRSVSRKRQSGAIPVAVKKAPKKPSRSGTAPAVPEDLIDSIGAGIYLVQKGKFISVSLTFEKLAGYTADHLVGKTFLDYVHPDDRKAVEIFHKKKSRDPYEYRFYHRNGGLIRFLETSGRTIFGKSRALLCSVMDITLNKPPAESFDLKDERYRTILEAIDEGFCEFDLEEIGRAHV